MRSTATTPEEYLESLPEERKEPMAGLRKEIKKNIPKGFKEAIAYGMISYSVPHSIYPPGYHCDPKLPLMLMSLGSQKNFIVLHHMGLYADPDLLKWFVAEYEKTDAGKLDMGKGCVRFKKAEKIPYKLIGELAAKLTPQQWVDKYESVLKMSKERRKPAKT